MKMYKTVCWNEIIKGKEFTMGSIVLELDNKIILVCSNFKHSKKQPLEIYVYMPDKKKWGKTTMMNEYTETMWRFYRKNQPKVKRKYSGNYAEMMKHDRKHKHAGGGSLIYDGSITDYECTKEPLHDFRRCYN